MLSPDVIRRARALLDMLSDGERAVAVLVSRGRTNQGTADEYGHRQGIHVTHPDQAGPQQPGTGGAAGIRRGRAAGDITVPVWHMIACISIPPHFASDWTSARASAGWCMADPNRRRLGRVFNEVPELYDRVRPGYPDQLFAGLATVDAA